MMRAAASLLAGCHSALPLLGSGICPALLQRGATASSLAGGAAAATSASTSSSAAPAAASDSLDLPGGLRVPYTPSLVLTGGPTVSPSAVVPCYRTIDASGQDVPGASVPHDVGCDLALRMYRCMLTLQTMDTLFYEAQRQGRFSFYMTCNGEEATNIGSAAALAPDDMVFAQYREQGVLLWRGYRLIDFANQLFGNAYEPGKGRQMPIHYGSRELCYQTISSPLATQMLHAVGAAYAMKLSGSRSVAVVYFGEGASSEGDAHAAFNFAATLGAPCIFVCRNNGYAISTPSHEQYKGDGIAPRGPVYGMAAVRVDGGDVRAVYNAISEARRVCASEARPVLVECMSYRAGHHSTSDDSSRYRTSDEMRKWRNRDPVARLRSWLAQPQRGWWDELQEQALRREARQQVVEALESASKVPKPPLSSLVTDVYREVPWHLREQRDAAMAFAQRHPTVLPPDVPLT